MEEWEARGAAKRYLNAVAPEGADVPRLTYTIPEAAKALGIGKDLAYRLAREGTLRTVKLGRRTLVPRKAVEALLSEGGA